MAIEGAGPIRDEMDRHLLQRVTIALAVAGVILLMWGYKNAEADPVVRSTTIALRGLPAGAKPIRLLLLADLHVAGPDTPPERISRIVTQANALHPDIVLLAGDFVAHKRLATSKPDFAAAVAPLQSLRVPLGVYAVLGNHDHWRGAEEAMIALRRVGVHVLNNDATQAGTLTIGGVDDAFTGNDDVDATVNAMNRLSGAKILLSHSPDVMPQVPSSIGLVVAGHTHCGQVALPFLGPIVTMSRFGRRYACGLVREGGKTLIVTSGIGTSIVPIRFGAIPDMWSITIRGRP